MFGTRLRSLSGGVAVALTCGLVGLPPGAASAAPRLAAPSSSSGVTLVAPGASDSSLSALNVTNGGMRPLAPAFDPAGHTYQTVANDGVDADVTWTPGTVGATVTVTANGVSQSVVMNTSTVPLRRNRNDIVLTVVSPGSPSTTTTYKVSVWRLAAPVPRVVRIANATGTVYGGTRMTVTLADGALPDYCDRGYEVNGASTSVDTKLRSFDVATGYTTETVSVGASPDLKPGKVDITVIDYCELPNWGPAYGVTTVAGGYTYTAGYPIDSVDVPATVTSATKIVFHGAGVNSDARISYWIEDADGVRVGLDNWNWTGNDNAVLYMDYDYDDWFKGSGIRTLHAGTCPEGLARMLGGGLQNCESIFSQAINWVEPKPADVSFSPTSGSVAGGTVVRLKGKFLASGTDDEMTIKVGGQDVKGYERIYGAEYDGDDTFQSYTQDYDIIEFMTPAAVAPGPVPITVTTMFGTATARGMFTYAAKPAIASIAPASVANTGGSILTLLGTGFGTAGRPTVVIGGVKSPSVTRISATKLTAVVPPSVVVGPVDVTVASQQGGGVSTAATLTLVAASTLPTVTAFGPAAGKVGDEVTATGTGFGAAGTAGVSVDGSWARVIANTATSITFEVPTTGTTGAKNVLIGSTTGAVTKTAAFTVLPDNGIATVTPGTIASYATGAGAKIVLTGAGFGAKGTVKVGSAAAVAYTSSGGGTVIANVVVPTGVAGSLPIVVTPTGATTALRSSVRVTAPAITYVGPSPYDARFGAADIDNSGRGFVFDVPITGGSLMRIQGSGFGPAGVLTLGTSPVVTTTWTDTAITFTAPARALGTYAVRVAPTGSSLPASRSDAVRYVPPITGLPSIVRIASVVDQSYPERNIFYPAVDVSDAFTITGTNLDGVDPSAVRVKVSDYVKTFTITPSVVTATSLTFAAPRGFTTGGFKGVEVITDVGADYLNYGIDYPVAGVQLTVSPNVGLCLKTVTAADGAVSYTPAVITVGNTGTAFGAEGTVTFDGVAITPTSYAANEVVLNLANLPSELVNPWGGKQIVITSADGTLPVQTVGFTCGVTPSVTTTIGGVTTPATVAAGTPYTLGYTTAGFIGVNPFAATAPDDYEYVTAANYGATAFDANVHAGAPVAAGEYYVRVALSRATFAREKYLGFAAAPIQLTITGTPLTITPVVNGSSTIVYKGELGDGTDSSPNDFDFTQSSAPDQISAVTWEYRDSVCEGGDPNQGWINGLPGNVAMSSPDCSGNGVTPSSWDVRVKTFEMKLTPSSPDRAIYYAAERPTVQVTITPRSLTVGAVRADRVYDGTTLASFGELTVTGAVEGENVELDGGLSTGEFGDANAGVNKPVTLAADLVLAGSAKANYTLYNPRPTVVGTISKGSAMLSLAASTSSVLLTQPAPITILPTVRDTRTNSDLPDGSGAAPVVLTSQTPSICMVAETTVTAIAAGTCVIAGSQAASVNYQAAVAASDDTSTTETVEIEVLGAPQTIAVVADDITVAVGDQIDPTMQASGLFDGDEVSGVEYDYYSGDTLLGSAPTDPGTYRVVPKLGVLHADNNMAYTNPTAFGYVAGTLVITPLPPTITSYSPDNGFTTGGTPVTITGTRLDTVRAVRIGAVTLRAGSFTVNEDGTALTFTTPQVPAEGVVDLILVAGTASAQDVYTYTESPVVLTPPSVPRSLSVTGGDRQFTVVFLPPISTGGSPITGYQASYDGGRTWRTVATVTHSGGTRAFTVRLLRNGVTYTVRIRAVNLIGPGPSTATRPVVVNSPRPPPIVHPPSEIAIPRNPDAYRGPQRYTRARNTTHAGLDARPITMLGVHQLTAWEGATLSKRGLFNFDSAVLTPMGRAEVRLLVTHMLLTHAVICEGYTDYAGQSAHELTLSRQRAATVCAALVAYGAHVRTTIRGYGEARPVIVGGTPLSREANRRVVVLVTS